MSTQQLPDNAASFHQIANNYERMTGGATRTIASELVKLSPPITGDSTILDNACGSGIMIEELYKAMPKGTHPTIKAADAAPSMIDLLKYKIKQEGWSNVEAVTSPGESLTYPDDSFTHSFTNHGLFFFKDADQGAAEIYRTLKPGGTAIISTWKDVGYWDSFKETESKIRPQAEHSEFPVSKEWEQASFGEGILRRAGFKNIQVSEHEGLMRADSLEAFADNLGIILRPNAMRDWTTEESAQYSNVMQEMLRQNERYFLDSETGKSTIRMIAYVYVCIK
ncbi:MAG: hypothetical protein MMC23_007056 [Stictis urceolatum]|nr:hypothetical protein [Stictis urceolata]